MIPSLRYRRSTGCLSRLVRRATSLTEVLAATVILGTAVYPALRITRDGMTISRDNETRHAVTNFCISKMEEHLALGAKNWTNGTFTGDFTTEGFATIKYSVKRSDAVADGGVVNKLMAVTCTVYNDTNSNNTADATEIKMTMGSKTSKMSIYQTVP